MDVNKSLHDLIINLVSDGKEIKAYRAYYIIFGGTPSEARNAVKKMCSNA